MTKRNEPRRLLEISRRDLIAAQVLMESEKVRDESIGFHLQQAAEKALKAWLSHLGVQFPLTHDLSVLVEMLDLKGENVQSFYPLLDLIPFGVQYRYELSDEDNLDRQEAYTLTLQLVEYVENLTLLDERAS